MSKNRDQLELDFGRLETFTKETRVSANSSDILVESTSHECNAAITQVCIKSEIFEDTKEESLQEEYTQEQILERRQEILQKRKRFVQTVLDAIYVRYQTEIDALILEEPKWQSLAETNFERVQRWGTARFIKQIVVDDQKLKELLKIKVDIDGSKKAIKDLPYIKSFLVRCRVGDDRLIGGGSLKGDEDGEIAAQRFQKIKDALEDYRVEVLREFKIVDGKKITYQVRVNGTKISLKNKLKNLNLRNEIVESLDSISDLKSFREWLEINFSLEQVSIENSDENILFCWFVSSLRKIVGENILPASINKIELYKSLLNGRFFPKSLNTSSFKIKCLDSTFMEYRDSLWESYLSTSDFFAMYPSYYFWFKYAPEAQELEKSHLGATWGMIPGEFREQWSQINLSFEDADKLYKAFEVVRKIWDGNAEAKTKFFTRYPSYYFWLKDAPEAEGLKKMNLAHVWGMIPYDFKDKWSYINLPFGDADKLHEVFEKVQNSWIGNEDVKEQFFTKYPSYYFWLKDAPEAQGLKKNHLAHVWGMIPGEFRGHWSKINLSFEDADKLYKAFEKLQNSWIGNEDVKEQFFTKYPSYYFWLKDAPEAQGLKKNNLAHVWGMIPGEFREQWSVIGLPFEDADKLHEAFEKVQNSWIGNEDVKEQFFTKYPSYYFWFKNAPEAQDLKKSYLGNVWGMIPDEFREQWSMIGLSFEDADKWHAEILDDSKTWCVNNSRAYMQHFSQINLCFSEYWGLIPTSLRQKFNLEYFQPGKIVYNGIKVDSKQEFAVLRVFEEVLGYEPEVGVNFQVEVSSQTAHTFDFKIEYQEEDSHVTHFFEWHPVVVSMSGGRNDAKKLDDYDGLLDLLNNETYSDKDTLIYANSLAEEDYYNKRSELLTNKTTNPFRGDVRLTCATAGVATGRLTKNIETLHGFLRQAKPDFELTLAQLTLMFKGCLGEAIDYEVESA